MRQWLVLRVYANGKVEQKKLSGDRLHRQSSAQPHAAPRRSLRWPMIAAPTHSAATPTNEKVVRLRQEAGRIPHVTRPHDGSTAARPVMASPLVAPIAAHDDGRAHRPSRAWSPWATGSADGDSVQLKAKVRADLTDHGAWAPRRHTARHREAPAPGRALTPAEVDEPLRDAFAPGTHRQPQPLIAVLYRGGLRVSEAQALEAT